MAEDGGLLLQLLQVDAIIDEVESKYERDDADMIDGEEVYPGGGSDW